MGVFSKLIGALWGGRALTPPRPDPRPPAFDGRTPALRALADYLTDITFYRENAAGQPPIKFKIDRENFLIEMPDAPHEMVMPSVVVWPSRGDYSAVNFTPVPEAGTDDMFGPNTVLVRQAEWIETLQLEAWASKSTERRAIIEGFEIAFDPMQLSGGVTLKVREYFNAAAQFTLKRAERFDDDMAGRDRRRVQFEVEYRMHVYKLVRQVPLQPRVIYTINGAAAPPAQVPLVTTKLISITPSSGSIGGGTAITITGFNLQNLTLLQIGGIDVTVTSNDGETILGVTGPSEAVGPADLVIETPQGNDTLAGAFDYIMPTPILSLDFTQMPLGGYNPPQLTVARASSGSVDVGEEEYLPYASVPNDTLRISIDGAIVEQSSTNTINPSLPPATDQGSWNTAAGTGGAVNTYNAANSPDGIEEVVEIGLPPGARSWNLLLSGQPANSVWSFWAKNRTLDAQAVPAKMINGQNPNLAQTRTIATLHEGTFTYKYWKRVSYFEPQSTFLTFDETQNSTNPPPYDFATLSGTPYGPNMRVWGWMNESGKIVTSYIPTTGAPVTRAADHIALTSAAAVVDNGTLTMTIEMKPHGAMDALGGDYPGDVYLWSDPNDNTSFIKLSSGKLVISAHGNVWTTNRSLLWGDLDLARAVRWGNRSGKKVYFVLVAGNGLSSAKYQVDGYPLVDLGVAPTSAPSLTFAGVLDLLCKGTSNTFSSKVAKIEFWRKGEGPTWLLFPHSSVSYTRQVVIVGTSIDQGIFLSPPAAQVWGGLMKTALGRSYLVNNIAISGGCYTAGIGTAGSGDDANRIICMAKPLARNIACLGAPTNDLAFGIAPATLITTMQTIVNNILAQDIAVSIATILPRSSFSEVTRQNMNTLLKNTFGSMSNVRLANQGDDPIMGAAGAYLDGTLFIDGVHPTALGQTYLAPYQTANVIAFS